MDQDTAHTFSESSRNTLIATAAVGKSVPSCSFESVNQFELVASMDAMLCAA